eukprot:PhF_6_TR38113/c0_g1_i2/m.56884
MSTPVKSKRSLSVRRQSTSKLPSTTLTHSTTTLPRPPPPTSLGVSGSSVVLPPVDTSQQIPSTIQRSNSSVVTSSRTRRSSTSTHGVGASGAVPPSLKVVAQFGAYHSAHVQQYLCKKDSRWRPVPPPSMQGDVVHCVPDRPLHFLWYKYDHIGTFPQVPTCDHAVPPCVSAAPREDLKAANVVMVKEEARPSVSVVGAPWSADNLIPRPDGEIPPGHSSTFSPVLRPISYHRIKFPQGTCIVGCFPDASAVWKKHLLWNYMKMWCDSDPILRGSVRERLPYTYSFDLNDPSSIARCETFFSFVRDRVQALICKHSTGANGRNIRVCPTIHDAIAYITAEDRTKKGGRNDWWVVQEFVMKSPLLFDRRRFHMRMHVLAMCTPYSIELFAYHKTRVQVCNEEYDEKTFFNVPDSVISNWMMQKKNKNFDTKTFYHMFEDLTKDYPLLKPVLPNARQQVCDSFAAALQHGR